MSIKEVIEGVGLQPNSYLRKQTKLWTTKDGEKIRICDMSDNHLLCTIRMLKRYGEYNLERAYQSVSMLAAMVSGEMALDAAERELDSIVHSSWDDFASDIICNLINDAERRGLRIDV